MLTAIWTSSKVFHRYYVFWSWSLLKCFLLWSLIFWFPLTLVFRSLLDLWNVDMWKMASNNSFTGATAEEFWLLNARPHPIPTNKGAPCLLFFLNYTRWLKIILKITTHKVYNHGRSFLILRLNTKVASPGIIVAVKFPQAEMIHCINNKTVP